MSADGVGAEFAIERDGNLVKAALPAMMTCLTLIDTRWHIVWSPVE